MAELQDGTINAHLKAMNASDLEGIADSKHVRTGGRILSSSQKNPSVGLLIENGKRHLLYGMGDPNFSPVRLSYDDQGKIDAVVVNNSGMSGSVAYLPEKQIVEAVIKAASINPAGKGRAVAALAKAAGATDQYGNCKWGTGLIRDAETSDTAVLSSAHLAVAAIQSKWAPHVAPLKPLVGFAKPSAPKPLGR